MTKTIRVSKVFIPGGFPRITYIAREEHQLENRVSSANDNLSKLLVVTDNPLREPQHEHDSPPVRPLRRAGQGTGDI